MDREVDMLDSLAYYCTELQQKLSNEHLTESDENDLLLEYLRSFDKDHKSIQDFKDDLDWFNVTEPLSFKDSLQGKVVVLDFFTYCCINCMHILPDLKKLEQKFKIEDGLVIVGVHSAKFDNEKDSANILSAIQRYEVEHPVVNDDSTSMWNNLSIKCWPTLLIVGPRANPLFIIMGEGQYVLLEKYVRASLLFYSEKGELKKHSLPINPATDLVVSTNFKFPAKIAVSKVNQKSVNGPELYAVSDSGNHRILIIEPDGHVLYKIGGKTSGFCDGDFLTVRFNAPQGITWLNESVIFVADTENHAIRRIDLQAKTVKTVAGTGRQGEDRSGGKFGIQQAISSPWDVAVYRTRDMDMSFHMDEHSIPEREILLIAMAGIHQIWGLFLDDCIWWKFKKYTAGTVVCLAGNGNEENRNNSYPQNAAFAQPSGLALSKENKALYIADSESSCVRKLDLSDGKVLAVVGGDRNPLNLFAFGDKDGKQLEAKLQHPLGVAYNHRDNSVFVADTYNHKIKRIDPNNNTVTTCDFIDEMKNSMQFNEPGGLCVDPSGTKLYVADTNNHSIIVVNLSDKLATPLKPSFNRSSRSVDLGQPIKFSTLKVKAQGGRIQLIITVEKVPTIKFTEEAQQRWAVYLPSDMWTVNKRQGDVRSGTVIELDISVPELRCSQEEETITLGFRLNLCAKNVCFPKIFAIAFPVVYSNDGLDCITEEVDVTISEDDIKL